MNAVNQLIPVIELVVTLLAAFAIFRIPAILDEKKKQTRILENILKAVQTADKNRRAEFEALGEE